MNKEPLSRTIFRYLLGFGLLFFLGMLYWSSLLIEGNMKEIRRDLNQVKGDITKLSAQIKKGNFAVSSGQAEQQSKKAVTTDGKNIFQPDPFSDKVLPNMLGDNFKPQGTYKTATYAKPQNLHPFSGFYDVSALVNLCSIGAGQLQFGIYETLSANGAEKMEEKINPATQLPEYWIYLRKDIFWEPLEQRFFGESPQLNEYFLKQHPVTAHDYKLWWDAFMNTNISELGAVSLRTYYSDVESIEIIDDYTFVVRWKGREVPQPDGKTKKLLRYTVKQWTGAFKPLPSFIYKYFADGTKIIEDDEDPDTYRKSSIWAQNFAQHWAKNIIASCGPWKFDGMTDQRILLKRNPNYPDPYAALMDTYELNFKSSPDTIWQEFKAGNLTTYSLQPEKVAEWKKFQDSSFYKEQSARDFAIKELEYFFRSYTYVGWNSVKPYFNNKKVRQALTLAIDRNRIIKQNMNNMAVPIHGTFFVNSDANNPNLQPLPFDPQTARKILEEEGWYDSDGDGIIDKEINGKRVPFSFTLMYYVKNQVTKSTVEYIATALKEVGIDCKPDGIDIADLTAKLDDKSFDAYILAWTLGTPPDDPRQIWHSDYAKVKGSSNTIGFANAEADKIIDQLDFEYNRERRLELYHRFDSIIADEQPYTFLYTPKIFLLYRETLQNVFLPKNKQDLIPGANVDEPQFSIYWLKEQGK